MGEDELIAQRLDLEIIPAILVKTKEKFLENINKVREYVNEIHIDVMDSKFVPNHTINPEEIGELPNGVKYEFHWMVEEPEKWIEKTKGDHLHQIHIETVKNWDNVVEAVKKVEGRLCIVLNPSTPVSKIEPYLKDVQRALIMSVVPGYSHQKYLESMEEKTRELRKKYPNLEIEIDGGIDFETIKRAAKAGADKFVSCSAVFSSQNIKEAIEKLKKNAQEGAKEWRK